MNVKYLLLRAIRHRLPEDLARTLLRKGIIIRPGLETREPAQAVARYLAYFGEQGLTFKGLHVLVFGYGGSLAVAVELLRAGCKHVTVCDLYPPVNRHINDGLLSEYEQYLQVEGDAVTARPEWITTYHGDIRKLPDSVLLEPFDLVVSSSVYEHLGDVDGITKALASLLKPTGHALAFIDLRDHYFTYPFEMLCYSDQVWKNWLNPTSNLNRFRVRDYRRVFERYFGKNQISILESNPENFQKVKRRIRAEFKSGDDSEDAVTLIAVMSTDPLQRKD